MSDTPTKKPIGRSRAITTISKAYPVGKKFDAAAEAQRSALEMAKTAIDNVLRRLSRDDSGLVGSSVLDEGHIAETKIALLRAVNALDAHVLQSREVTLGESGQQVSLWLEQSFTTGGRRRRETTGFDAELTKADTDIQSAPSETATTEQGDSEGELDGSPQAEASISSLPLDQRRQVTFQRTQGRRHTSHCSKRKFCKLLRRIKIPEIPRVGDPDFDIWVPYEQHHADIFHIMCLNILLRYNFVWSLEINVEKLVCFLKTIQSLYSAQNPFHNQCHAADVLQTVHAWLSANDLKEHFSDLELIALLFAALIHDVGHLGINNAFLVKTGHPLAVLFNDASPLENMHVAIGFEVLSRPECNFFKDGPQWTRKHFEDFRCLVVQSVLATDPAQHSSLVGFAATILSDNVIEDDEVPKLFRAIIHAADLSNPLKPLPVYKQWVCRVMAEFWQQGDEERRRGLPISMMCDRNGANIGKSQIGFINFIVKPFMTELAPVLPPVFMERLESNLRSMESLVEKDVLQSIEKLAARPWHDIAAAEATTSGGKSSTATATYLQSLSRIIVHHGGAPSQKEQGRA